MMQSSVSMEPQTLTPLNLREFDERSDPFQPASELRNHASDLKALFEVGNAIVEGVDLQGVLRLVVDRACTQLGIGRCCLYLLDEDREYLHGRVAFGTPDEWISRYHTRVSRDPFTRQVLESRLPVYVPDAWHDDRIPRQTVVTFGIKSILGVPLVVDGEVLGAIFLDDYRERLVFSPKQMALAMALASQAGLAVVKSRLAERLARVQPLDQLSRLLERTVSAGELDGRGFLDSLVSLVLEEDGIRKLASALGDLLHNPVLVLDQFYNTVANSGGLATSIGIPKDYLTSALSRPQTLPGTCFDGVRPERPLAVVPVSAGTQVLGYLCVFAINGDLSQAGISTAEQTAKVIALKMLQERASYCASASRLSDLLEDLVQGQYENEAAMLRRASYHGYDLSTPQVVMVLDVEGATRDGDYSQDGQSDVRERLLDVIKDVLDGYCSPSLAAAIGSGIVVLATVPIKQRDGLTVDPRLLAQAIRERWIICQQGAMVSVGIGSVCRRIGELRTAYSEARQTVEFLRSFGRQGEVMMAEQLGVMRFLFHTDTKSQLAHFAEHTLGPLLEYDGKHHTGLLQTLEVLIQNKGNLRRTADDLFLHISSLHYRLERIREVAQVDLDDAETLLNLHLALKILRATSAVG